MENVLQLGFNQEVLNEGWLYKKGSAVAGESFHLKSPKNRGKFNLYALRKRYFILLRTKPHEHNKSGDAYISYFLRKAKIVPFKGTAKDAARLAKSSSRPNPENLGGKNNPSSTNGSNASTKKNYISFSLSRARLTSKKNSGQRYSPNPGESSRDDTPQGEQTSVRKTKSFNEKPTPSFPLREKKRTTMIGMKLVSNVVSAGKNLLAEAKIILTPNSKAYIEKKKIIKLVNPGKTHYLEAISGAKEADSAAIVAGQWIQVIRHAISALSAAIRQRDMQNRNSLTFFSPAVALSRSAQDPEIPIPTEMKEVLQDHTLKKEFMDYLRLLQASENLEFYDEAEDFRKKVLILKKSKPTNMDFKIKKKATAIIDKYILSTAKTPVNISSNQRGKIEEKYNSFNARFENVLDIPSDFDRENSILSENLFMEAQDEVYLLMEANFFHGFYSDLSKRTGCFAVLLRKHFLRGYNLVVSGHFGNVKTEIERLVHRYHGRINELNVELAVLNKQLQLSSEAAVPELSSSSAALASLYEMSVRKVELLNEFKTVIENDVKALENLRDHLRKEIKNIIVEDDKKIAKYKQLLEDKKVIVRFKDIMEKARTNFRKGALKPEDFDNELKQYRVTPDNLEEKYAQSQKDFMLVSASVVKGKDRLKADLLDSLVTLEKLDVRRLNAQETAMKNILEAESLFLRSIRTDTTRLNAEIMNINISNDIKSYSTHLIETYFTQ